MSKEEDNKNIKRILDESITEQMRSSYLDYAMSVITSRALPDVRDGLKPVQRRILFSMHGMGLNHSAKTRKSAAVVGEVLGKYHPHGNQAVYDAMVKLAQSFGTRYPLVIGQGNFGSIDGDPPAAERYTEAKLSKISESLMRDLEKDTVRWIPNYENTREEPTVLPAIAPNLLLNGTLGIAVGMATSIPPHNLKEVCDAIKYLLENKEATTVDLLKFVKGPDFPTGAVAYDKKAIANAYATGRGGVVVRGEAEIVEEKNKVFILITSLPYKVNKSDLMSKIGDLVKNKKIQGVKELRDESTEDIRVVIELKSSAQPNLILNTLYKNTLLEQTFHYNMVALVEGVPRTISLTELLDEYLKHRRTIIKRRTEFDLKKAKEREHILSGLSKALDHIDKIIALIKKSKDVQSAHKGLMKEFKFSEIQATSILEMKLQKLASLERKKIEDQLKEVRSLIKELESILESKKKIDNKISEELDQLMEGYADERRTKIKSNAVGDIGEEDLISDEDTVLILTVGGYIKRTNPREYKTQKRGGVGVQDLNTKEEDVIHTSLTASTRSTILFFTDKGKVYKRKMYELPEGKKTTKGKSIVNFISIDQDEKVTSVLAINEKENKFDSVILCTKQGVVKRLSLSAFDNIRKTGIISVKLNKEDKLQSSIQLTEGDDVMLHTNLGKSIRFKVSSLRKIGRGAQGVKGIKLSKGDLVISAFSIPKDSKEAKILTVSEKGYAKMTKHTEYKTQTRGGSGIKTMEITKKTGNMVSAHLVEDEKKEIIAISKKCVVVRFALEQVSISGRSTQGVRIMKLRTGDSIASTTQL